MKPSPADRRKYQRVAVRIPAGVYLKSKPYDVIDAEILDISTGGAFVHCTAPINIGEEVIVEIRFGETRLLDGRVVPHDKLNAQIPTTAPEQSIVRWARGSSYSGFGIEFTNLRPEKKKFVVKLVEYFESLKNAGVSINNE
ncbi:MAG: PilZ domain-containing protein [Deltaproteobacteria bacterium]|nr:PilZ domain-containing protein [Deltaproteobacteria bacterium]